MFDTMTLTKIAAAFCSALLVLVLGGWIADKVYSSASHGKDHGVAWIETDNGNAAEVAVEEGPVLADLLASADLEKGAKTFKKCAACHKLEDEKNNYLWVTIYESPKKYINRKSWFNAEKKYGIPNLMGGVDVQRYGSFVYKTEKRYDNDLDAKYILFNWTFPKNLNSAMELADKISSSFKSDMKKSGMASWGMATRIIPQDSDLAPLFFWDAYENMEQMINHLMNKAAIKNVDQKLLAQFQEELPNGWDKRIIWEFVARTN